jgi:hypothetical protein
MRDVWKHLLPYCANDFCDFENRVDAVIQEIITTGKNSGFEDIGWSNVRKCLDSHSYALTDIDLIKLEQQHTYDEEKKLHLKERVVFQRKFW